MRPIDMRLTFRNNLGYIACGPLLLCGGQQEYAAPITRFHIFDATCIPELSPEHLKWHGLQLTSILKGHPLETTRAHSVLVIRTLRLSAC